MPYIEIKTNASFNQEQINSLKSDMGKNITAIPGKSEYWLMVDFCEDRNMFFKGNNLPCAMVDVSIFGKAEKKYFDELTEKICDSVSSILELDKDRIYVKYSEIEKWGWNGVNF